MNNLKGTTIVACKRDGKTVIGADSQATLDTMVFKDGVKKLYRIYKFPDEYCNLGEKEKEKEDENETD